MKAIAVSVVFMFAGIFGMCQEIKKDSVFYKNRYYYSTEPDFEKILPAYEKLNFETYFIPGLGYGLYSPEGADSTGVFSGITVNYLIYGKMYQNNKPGPSIVRFYSKLSIMNSDKDNIKDLFFYSLGLSFSFEKNPKRSVLIPYFGLEFGGLSQSQWGTTAQFTPTFGLHLLAKRNVFISLQGGYIYPVTQFDLLQGVYLEAGINYALW